MKKKHQKMIKIIITALILTLMPCRSSSAATQNLNVWFSNTANGGYCPYAKTGQEIYINSFYNGTLTDYKVTVQVTKDNNRILSKTLSKVKSLSEKIILSESGTYFLFIDITQNNESIISKTSSVEVYDNAPFIISQPKDVVTKEYNEVTFSCESESAAASYQWYMSKSLYKEGTEISGASDSKLTITAKNVTSLNEGYYYCVVTYNHISLFSNYAKLTVQSSIKPTAAPANSVSNPNTTSVVTKRITLSTFYDAKKVTLKWNSGGKLYVYRSASLKGPYKYIGSGTNSYKDKTAKPNKKYYYYVKGTGFLSYTKSITTNAKPIIKKFQAKKKNKKVTLSWELKRTNHAKVTIYIKTGKKFQKLGTVSASKKPCRLVIPQKCKVSIKIKAYNTINKKKYYSKYSKAITLKF